MTNAKRVSFLLAAPWIAFAASLALCLWLFHPVFVYLNNAFRDSSQDMAHGWFVPLFSLYLLWRKRDELAAAEKSPSWAGLCAVLAALLLHWVGARGELVQPSHLALIGLCLALPWAFWGRHVAKILFFPCIFLIFTIPVSFMDVFTVWLRLLASATASVLLNGVGIEVARTGTGLHCLDGAGFNLDVADPCSGMRSIFAMMALTAGYGYLTQRSWRRLTLFVCSVPLAIFGNIVRIFLIGVVARLFGEKAATGFYHDYSGYVVFVVAVLLMMEIGRHLSKFDRAQPSVETTPTEKLADTAPSSRHHAGLRRWIFVVAPLALGGVGLLLRSLPPSAMESQHFLRTQLPDVPGFRSAQPWFCQNDQCLRSFDEVGSTSAKTAISEGKCPFCGGALSSVSLGEHHLLPADTLNIKRNYYGDNGNVFRISVVVNGESRMSIHRPEQCLPGQGFSLDKTWFTDVALPDGTGLRVKLVNAHQMRERGAAGTLGQAYWFVSAKHQTASHYSRLFLSATERAFENRVVRWSMISISSDAAFDSPESIAHLKNFIRAWYPQLRQTPDDSKP
jgi:exosortase